MSSKLLKSLRKKKAWTQRELAKELGCSLKSIQNWERGRVAPPYVIEFVRHLLKCGK